MPSAYVNQIPDIHGCYSGLTSVGRTGNACHAEGNINMCWGAYCHAEGERNVVHAVEACHVEGYMNVLAPCDTPDGNAVCDSATYTKNRNEACYFSHCEGADNHLTGHTCHCEGQYNHVHGMWIHCEGSHNYASGQWSHTQGYYNENHGYCGHAEGRETSIAENVWCSHVEGRNNQTSGDYSHVEGHTNVANDTYEHIEGFTNTAYGTAAHVEGRNNTCGSVGASGYPNKGDSAHVEGYSNTVDADAAHCEGYSNTVTGPASHCEGYANVLGNQTPGWLGGRYSHCEGTNNTVSHDWCHVEGKGNVSSADLQHIFGQYCVDQYYSNQQIMIIGNGYESYNPQTQQKVINRMNIFCVDDQGNLQCGMSDDQGSFTGTSGRTGSYGLVNGVDLVQLAADVAAIKQHLGI